MMSFNEFRVVIEQRMRESNPDRGINVIHVGGSRYNLALTPKSGCITPSARLNDFYEDYCKVGDIDRTLKEISEILTDSQIPDINIAILSDYKALRERIRIKVCKGDYELNEHVHRKFLNMLILAYIDLGNEESGLENTRATCQVNGKILDLWGITEEKLFQDAMQNEVDNDEVEFIRLDEVVKACLNQELPETPFCVLTNKQRVYGARLILQSGVLDRICHELGEDVYLIPSSIHEGATR